jgi:DNA-binding FrmR family transcriptional regulator
MQDKDKLRSEVINRLRRVEGQIRGIQKLVEDDAECRKVASQIKAARTALDAAGKLVLACYLAESMKDGQAMKQEALDMLVKF